MDNKLKYLLAGVAFIVCGGAAYLVTKHFHDPENNNELVASEGEGVSGDPAPRDSVETSVNDTQKDAPTVPEASKTIIMKTEVQKIGDSYALQVTCINVPVNVILEYAIPALRQKNSDGYFTRIPGCKSGSYKVNVVNSNTGEILASKTVSGFKIAEEKAPGLMTAHEFQALLLNQNDNSLLGGKHPNVAKDIKLIFEGLREDDKKPGDILAIREKIAFGIWSSAKVIGVNYDDNGKIYAARIQPIY